MAFSVEAIPASRSKWCRFAPEAGYRMVDAACRMLYSLWP